MIANKKKIAVFLAVLIAVTIIFNTIVYGIDIVSVVYFAVLLFLYIQYKSISDTI